MSFRLRLLAALLVGLAAASVPILASTREHCGGTSAPPADAPRYLVLAAAPTYRDLRCGPIAGRVSLERVASAGAASERIEDEAVAGIIFERAALDAAPDGMVRAWLTAGTGRVLIGMQLTKWEVEAYLDTPPRAVEGLPLELRGQSRYFASHDYIARLHFSRRNGGTCGGRGTPVYFSETALADLLVVTAEGCRFG